MRDLNPRYETDQPFADLPPLPPVSHLELGRQEPLLANREPVYTNSNLAPEQPVVTDLQLLDHVKAALDELLDDAGPIPRGFPFEDPDHVMILKPPTPGLSERGIAIYWTDSQGRTWGPCGKVG